MINAVYDLSFEVYSAKVLFSCDWYHFFVNKARDDTLLKITRGKLYI